MFTGTKASVLDRGVKHVVSVTAYPFLKVKASFKKASDYVLGFAVRYDAVRKENQVLGKEIIQLKQMLANRAELRQENVRLREALQFVRETPRLTLELVDVLENYKGLLRIDRGSLHGITPSMCLITKEGVVGVITEVSTFTAIAATLNHPECRVGAMVKRNRLRAYDGVVHAGGGDFSPYCRMDYIDMKEDVRVGDVVVTSPESIFPAGCPIGIVTATHEGGSLWKWAEIAPMVDPSRLDEVFLIRHAEATLDELTGPPAVVPNAVYTGELPDERSMQERYAP